MRAFLPPAKSIKRSWVSGESSPPPPIMSDPKGSGFSASHERAIVGSTPKKTPARIVLNARRLSCPSSGRTGGDSKLLCGRIGLFVFSTILEKGVFERFFCQELPFADPMHHVLTANCSTTEKLVL